MRILVLASYVPSLYKGAEIRLLYLLRHLSQNHEITLWAINRRSVPEKEIAALLPDCELALQEWPSQHRSRIAGRIDRSGWVRWLQKQTAFFNSKPSAIHKIYHPALEARLEKLLSNRHFDLIHVNQIMVWQYLPQSNTSPVILCKDNVWTRLAENEWKAATGSIARQIKKREAAKMHHYESAAISSSNYCVVVSERDEVLTKELAPKTPISVIPNGVDTRYFQPAPENTGPPKLVFTGAMAWNPNAEAMVYFCREILPIIQREFTDVQLSIVGLHPPAEVKALGTQPNIQVTGFVSDVRPYIAEATVYIVPLRAGSGTRLKILEALSMGKAVVSTHIGAEGLDVVDGRHLLLADEPQEFAAKICNLLRDSLQRRALGQAGRALAEERYDWQAIAAKLDKVYHLAVQVQG